MCVGAGAIGAVYYMARLATRNPDVTWNRTSNPEPWQEYKDKQYKVGTAALIRTTFLISYNAL